MSESRLTVLDTPSWVSSGYVEADGLLDLLSSEVDERGAWEGILALFTDKAEWTAPDELDVGHVQNLLELRAYNKRAELHVRRSDIVSRFAWRLVDDADQLAASNVYDARFDEEQFLDIDSVKSNGQTYVATGGGVYQLPVADAEKLLVRNYLVYGKSDGMARVVDFRIVGLLERRA